MGQETVVALQLAVRRAVAELFVQEPAPEPESRARQYRQVAAFLVQTAKDLDVLAACELGLAAFERDPELVAALRVELRADGQLGAVVRSAVAPRSQSETATAGPATPDG
jgi:hypothetical protein